MYLGILIDFAESQKLRQYSAQLLMTIPIYSVIHNYIAPSKELCSKMAQREVGVSLP